MRKWCAFLVVALFLFGVDPGFSQTYPKTEVFGGYSLLHIDTQGATGSSLVVACNDYFGTGTCPPGSFQVHQNFNGWTGAIQYNINDWFGMAADFSGHYGTPVTWDSSIQNLLNANDISLTPPKASSYSYLFGPVVSNRTGGYTVFAHALLGVNDISEKLQSSSISGLTIPGVTQSDSAFAVAFGGGIDVKVRGALWLRAAQADYLLTLHGPTHQNNIRISAGIVYRFGETSAPNSISQKEQGIAIPALGVRAITPDEGGAEIIEVVSSSVADLAGLRSEDVIIAVDGKPIHSAMELTAELANHAPGEIKLGCLIQGAWHTEVTLVLRPH